MPPDLDGACVGFGDLLQKAGIISNDRWIASWDGSRVVEWRVHNLEPQTVAVIANHKEENSMEEVHTLLELV